MGKPRLKFYEKSYLFGRRYVLEAKIWTVDDDRYKDGVKYSLIFVELRSGRKVLLDNHHPKGHHVHLDDQEFGYPYCGDKQLIADFKNYVYQHFGVNIMKKLVVSLKSPGEALKDFERSLAEARKGKRSQPHFEVSFDNRRDFEKFLRNINILISIQQLRPSSVNELARLIEKDQSTLNKLMIFF